MPQHFRPYPIFAATLLTSGLAMTALAQGPPGAAPGGAPPKAELREFAARGGDWAWITKRGERYELLSGGPDGKGRKVAEGADWAEVAVGAGQIWVLERKGELGRLLQVARTAEGEPKEVAGSLQQPGGLFAADDQVYWLEMSPAPDPGLAFIPTLGGELRLRRRDSQGAVSTLGAWPAGGRLQPREVEIIGTHQDRLYLSTYSGVGTEFLSVSLASGSPVRVAAEAGYQHGVLHNGRLVWTAPSDEATPSSGIRQLKAHREGMEPEVLADWVPRIGNVLSVGSQLRYAGAGRVFQVPGSPNPPLFSRNIPFGPVTTDGKNLIELSVEAPVSHAP